MSKRTIKTAVRDAVMSNIQPANEKPVDKKADKTEQVTKLADKIAKKTAETIVTQEEQVEVPVKDGRPAPKMPAPATRAPNGFVNISSKLHVKTKVYMHDLNIEGCVEDLVAIDEIRGLSCTRYVNDLFITNPVVDVEICRVFHHGRYVYGQVTPEQFAHLLNMRKPDWNIYWSYINLASASHAYYFENPQWPTVEALRAQFKEDINAIKGARRGEEIENDKVS